MGRRGGVGPQCVAPAGGMCLDAASESCAVGTRYGKRNALRVTVGVARAMARVRSLSLSSQLREQITVGVASASRLFLPIKALPQERRCTAPTSRGVSIGGTCGAWALRLFGRA
eukprot:1567853-Prymnesium_polylepis.1